MTCSKNRSSSERNELLIRFRQTVEFARVKSMPEWCIERDRGVYGYLNNNIQGNGRWYSCKTVMISSCALVGILNTAQNGYFILAAHPNIRFKNSSIHTNEGKTIKKSRSTCTPIEWSTCFSFYLYFFQVGVLLTTKRLFGVTVKFFLSEISPVSVFWSQNSGNFGS